MQVQDKEASFLVHIQQASVCNNNRNNNNNNDADDDDDDIDE